jgi:hypothetical protein
MTVTEGHIARVREEPLSVRGAMGVIASAAPVTVVAGGVMIRLLGPEELPEIGVGMPWAL